MGGVVMIATQLSVGPAGATLALVEGKGAKRRAAYLGPARRRPLVLDAATQAFAAAGYADTSMADVAARAGVAKAVIYSCFPAGKLDLYRAVIRRCELRVRQAVKQVRSVDADVPASLAEGLRAFLRLGGDDPATLALLAGGTGTDDPRVVATVERAWRRVTSEFVRGLNLRSAAPAVADRVRIEICISAILGVAADLVRRASHDPTFAPELHVPWLATMFARGLSLDAYAGALLDETATPQRRRGR